MVRKQQSILIHSIAFSPDGVSTAYLYNDVALTFKRSGYRVIVLTTTPHYNRIENELVKQPLKKRWGGLFYKSFYYGIEVYHVPQKKFKSTLLRMFGFVYWHIASFFLGVFSGKIDAIISPSPPLTIGIINLAIGWLKGSKVVYNVQEIYPDFLINQGKLSSGFLKRFLKWLERFVYNNSDAVTTIDEIFYETIKPRFEDVSKLHIVPNFVDTELYRPRNLSGNVLDTELFQEKKGVLKLMYAGNIGHAQDWNPLLESAAILQKRGVPVEFWVVGEGVMKEQLKNQLKNMSLSNVHLVPYQPREQMPLLIAYADLHFIFMSQDMDGQGFPSKVYTILACEKPLLVVSSSESPISNFLSPIGAAYLVNAHLLSEKVDEIISIIEKAVADRDVLKKMGKRGRTAIVEKYSSESVTRQYVRLVDSLILKGNNNTTD